MSSVASLAPELFVPALRALSQSGEFAQQRAQETGLAILAEHAVNIENLADLKGRIPYSAGVELLENAVDVSGDETFVLKAASHLERGDLGLYQFLTGSAATLREAIALAIRHIPLLNDGVRLELTEVGELAHWRQHPLPHAPPSHVTSEYLMAAFLAGARQMLGLSTPPIEVWMMHGRPRYHSSYETFLGSPVEFNRECNAIVMHRAALSMPLSTADDALLRVLQPYAAQQLAGLRRTQPFLRRVRDLMRSRLAEDVSLIATAQQLNMSESTVQRRLRAMGTSHRDLLDELRREEALRLLADLSLNVNEIAFRLGFSHRSALHRAYIRWYGCSASEHRMRAQQTEFYRFYRGNDGARDSGIVAPED